ncbi:MAG: von Willebrand factor type A domain-containing protein [Myxococcota bacterium]
MTSRPELIRASTGRSPVVAYLLVLLSMSCIAGCMFLPPPKGAETEPQREGSGSVESPALREPDPFRDIEEMVVAETADESLLARSSVGQRVYFDAANLVSLGYEADGAGGQPHLEMSRSARQTERYDEVEEAGFLRPQDSPLSTFSVDVDTASYTNMRRFLREGMLPPEGAIRIEELVNYFRYEGRDPEEQGDDPFSVDLEIFDAPWAKGHQLVRIALEAKQILRKALPARNLVFLLDVSGSMEGPYRLGLVQYGMTRLVESLRPQDRVAIVVYAGASGLALPSTPGDQESRIVNAIEGLRAEGSTAGAEGIRLAYKTARKHFDPKGINRVILATDGDFNVGVSSRSELIKLIEEERESGIDLTVLGVGRGNLNDAAMEQLADHGNGNYAYLDSRAEARRVLVEQANATLISIAKDVKVQVEFNPQRVQAYRLIGYENRRLASQDFNDDRRDAGEIGAGHHVTALYEIVPVGAKTPRDAGVVDPLKYSKPRASTALAEGDDWLTVKLRYKRPGRGADQQSLLISRSFSGEVLPFRNASEDARFSSAVALFGMTLRDSAYRGRGSFSLVADLAEGALGDDEYGERKEFLSLVALAKKLD